MECGDFGREEHGIFRFRILLIFALTVRCGDAKAHFLYPLAGSTLGWLVKTEWRHAPPRRKRSSAVFGSRA
jgi:hypothetical protein